jgi:MFS family permease
VALTLTVIGFSGIAQALATRVGIRPLLPIGMLMAAGALVLYAQLPVNGHYFWDLFPAFIISGVGLALAFIPMTIGALAGVPASEAGIASGLINTSQQVGGAIGVAVATTIATTFTRHYLNGHPGQTALSGPALTYGFQIAFYALAAVAVAGAVLAFVMIESQPPVAEEAPVKGEVALEAA